MKTILAIDPGTIGGLAWVDRERGYQGASMPQGMTAQADEFRSLAASHPDMIAVIEKVGTYRPGNSGPAAAKFARHCGNLEAALYVLGIPTIEVAPHTWQKALGSLPRDKRERKRAIREQMARRYPAVNVTLKTADALGILTWALKQEFTGSVE